MIAHQHSHSPALGLDSRRQSIDILRQGLQRILMPVKRGSDAEARGKVAGTAALNNVAPLDVRMAKWAMPGT
jgi:virulence-associated protein VagC